MISVLGMIKSEKRISLERSVLMDFTLKAFHDSDSPPSVVAHLIPKISNQTLRLRFELEGNLENLSWPDFEETRFVKGLWESTCFEIFLFDQFSEKYREWNFSPSGAYWCADYQSYRGRYEERVEVKKPSISAFHSDRESYLQVDFPLEDIHSQLNLCCVLNFNDGLQYYALQHSGQRPDFHRKQDAFLEFNPFDETKDAPK